MPHEFLAHIGDHLGLDEARVEGVAEIMEAVVGYPIRRRSSFHAASMRGWIRSSLWTTASSGFSRRTDSSSSLARS
jgi:hypothetical protein